MGTNIYSNTISVEYPPSNLYHSGYISEWMYLSDNLSIKDKDTIFKKLIQLINSIDSVTLKENILKTINIKDYLMFNETVIPALSFIDKCVFSKDYIVLYKVGEYQISPPYHYETWYIEDPTVGSNVKQILIPYFLGKIENVSIHCKNKGISGKTVVDVKLNGDSIFYSPDDYPVLYANSSSNVAFSNKPVKDMLSKGDILTLDILEIANGASGLTVNVSISQTVIPLEVSSVKVVGNSGFVYNSVILKENSVKFVITFNTSILFYPKITLRLPDGTSTTVQINKVYSTNNANDTVETEYIDTSNFNGIYSLNISDAISSSFNNQTPFTYELLFFNQHISDLLSYDRYISNNILPVYFTDDKIVPNCISLYSYSLNNTDWTVYFSLSNPFNIDITNSSVGGNNNEGDKTVYVRFKNNNSNNYIQVALNIKYYYSNTNINIKYSGYLDRIDRNKFVIKYELPTTSTVIPPKKIEIYNNYNNIKLHEIFLSHLPLSGFNITVTDNGNQTATISVSNGYILDNNSELQFINGNSLTTDTINANEGLLYLVFVNLNTYNTDINLKIRKGNTNLYNLPLQENFIRENISLINQKYDLLTSDIGNIETKIIISGILLYRENSNIKYIILPYKDYFTIVFDLPIFPELGITVKYIDLANRVGYTTITNQEKLYDYTYRMFLESYYSDEIRNGQIITDVSKPNNIYTRFYIKRR